MDRQFGLDFKAPRKRRKGLHETPRHGSIAGQDVCDTISKQCADKAGQHFVAETVAGPVRFQIRFDADSVDHVDLVPNDGTDQREGAGRVIGIVAIDQEVNVGLDVCEHSTNDVTFAL